MSRQTSGIFHVPNLNFTTKVLTPLLRSKLLTSRDIVNLASTTKAVLLAVNVQDPQNVTLPLNISKPETMTYLETYFATHKFEVSAGRVPAKKTLATRRASAKNRDRSASPANVPTIDEGEDVKRRMTTWRFTKVVLRNDITTRAFFTLMSNQGSQASQALRNSLTDLAIEDSSLDFKQLEVFGESLRSLTLNKVSGWPRKLEKSLVGLLPNLRELYVDLAEAIKLEPGFLAALFPRVEILVFSAPQNQPETILQGLMELRQVQICGGCSGDIVLPSTRIREWAVLDQKSETRSAVTALGKRAFIEQKGLRALSFARSQWDDVIEIPSASGHIQSLDLSGSPLLKSVMELRALTGLIQINLSGCTALTKLPSLADSHGLIEIDAGGCTQLASLTGLSGCSKLARLKLSGAVSLPDAALMRLNSCTSLKELDISGCSNLESVAGISLPSLQRLRAHGCLSLKDGPTKLSGLKWLDMSKCPSLESLSGIEGLQGLTYINIADCRGLLSLAPLAAIDGIEFIDCSGSTVIGLGDVVRGCSKLETLRASNLRDVDKIDVSGNPAKNIIAGLKHVEFNNCEKLADASSLVQFRRTLIHVELDGSSLESLKGIAELSRLKVLRLRSSSRLQDVQALSSLAALEEVDLSGCSAIEGLRSTSDCPQLRWIKLNDCPKLSKLPEDLEDMPRLARLELNGSEAILFSDPRNVRMLLDLKKNRRVFTKYSVETARKHAGPALYDLLDSDDRRTPSPVHRLGSSENLIGMRSSFRSATSNSSGNACVIC